MIINTFFCFGGFILGSFYFALNLFCRAGSPKLNAWLDRAVVLRKELAASVAELRSGKGQ